jgi:DNA-binding NarL/FixJ family response regulator
LWRFTLENKYLSTNGLDGDEGFGGVKLLLRATLRDDDRMVAVIEKLITNNDSVESDVVDVLVQNVVKNAESLASKLTNTELQVLALAGGGAVNKSIATQLKKSPAYIGNTFTQIFTKLDWRQNPGVNPRVAACRQYLLEFGFDKSNE